MVVRAAVKAESAGALTLRRGLLVVAAAALITGVLAGLARLGIFIGWGPRHLVDHGPLLVLGAFATIIALERAVALGRTYGLVAPGLGAFAAVAMLTGARWAPWAAVVAAALMVVLNVMIVRRQVAAFTLLMLLGAAPLLVGNIMWTLGRPVFAVVPAWLGFFVITIVAERLELSRLAPTPRWAHVGVVVVATLLASSTCAHAVGLVTWPRVTGAWLILLGSWQLAFDLARHTVRRVGLPRFAAVGVLGGAAWLVVAGVLLGVYGLPAAGPHYDAALHAVFVGFVFAMVFAHAPIILPAVARVQVRFTRWLYLPLVVLHGGLVGRIVGDLFELAPLRRAGAVASAAALGLFVVVVLGARWARRPG